MENEQKRNEEIAQHYNRISQQSESVEDHFKRIAAGTVNERGKGKISGVRYINNWIKSVIINKYIKLVRYKLCRCNELVQVLDLGCGKGGDIHKWKKSKVGFYIGLDISPVAIEVAISRYSALFGLGDDGKQVLKTMRAKFGVIDCFSKECTPEKISSLEEVSGSQKYNLSSYKRKIQKNRKFEELSFPHKDFHLVASMFALHYAFSSKERIDITFGLVSDFLKPGGVFIATIPNERVIKHLLNGKKEYRNTVFSIELIDEEYTYDENIHVQPYLFDLVEAIEKCKEYTVSLPLIHKAAEKAGMVVESYIPFWEFFMRHYQKKFGTSLRYKMGYGGEGHLKMSDDEKTTVNLYSCLVLRKLPVS